MKKKPTQDIKPIAYIMNIKSNEDLRSYLEERPELNLSLMKEKNESTLLHFATFKNELPKLKIYILHFEAFSKENHKRNKNEASFQSQLKAWINIQNSDGLSAIHFAALHGNIQMIEFLQRYGANMQVQSNEKENILFMCAENNRLKAAIYLLEHREGKIPFNVNEGNHLGDTILHKTAKHGFLNFTSYLLNFKLLDTDSRNNEGWTPLMYAVSGGHKEIVKRMLVKGVNRYLINQQEKKAIDLARQLNKGQIQKILNDDFTNTQKIKIACNYKMVYEVQHPSVKKCILFLVLFHLVLLPTNALVEIDFLGNDMYYLFYAIVGLYYVLTMVIFILLTRKHPKKTPKNLLQVQLPICPQCQNTIQSTEFHCFICKVCISRYDHHCPWINNCVSSYNIGKFTSFLILLIIGSVQVLFVSLSFYFKIFSIIKPNRFIDLPEDQSDKYYLINMIVSGILSSFFCIGVFSLLGDQLKNLSSNSTSYQRAKNIKKNSSTLLSANQSQEDDLINSINGENKQIHVEDEQDETNCFSNCCIMLKENYNYEK